MKYEIAHYEHNEAHSRSVQVSEFARQWQDEMMQLAA